MLNLALLEITSHLPKSELYNIMYSFVFTYFSPSTQLFFQNEPREASLLFLALLCTLSLPWTALRAATRQPQRFAANYFNQAFNKNQALDFLLPEQDTTLQLVKLFRINRRANKAQHDTLYTSFESVQKLTNVNNLVTCQHTLGKTLCGSLAAALTHRKRGRVQGDMM